MLVTDLRILEHNDPQTSIGVLECFHELANALQDRCVCASCENLHRPRPHGLLALTTVGMVQLLVAFIDDQVLEPRFADMHPTVLHSQRINMPQRVDSACLLKTSPTASAPSSPSTPPSQPATSSTSSTISHLFSSLILRLRRVIDEQGVKGQRIRQDEVSDGRTADVERIKRDGVATFRRHLHCS